MADTIPAAWRTPFRIDAGHFGRAAGLPSAMAGTLSGMRPELGRPRVGAIRRELFRRHPSSLFTTGSDAVAQERLAMQKIKDVLRLHLAGG